MSPRKWLNEHSLQVSTLGFSALVALLYYFGIPLQQRLHVPYIEAEYRFQDWVAFVGRPAPKDPRIYFLADDAPSHQLDQLWEDEIAASPTLQFMKKRSWSREVWAHVLTRLSDAGALVVGFDY